MIMQEGGKDREREDVMLFDETVLKGSMNTKASKNFLVYFF